MPEFVEKYIRGNYRKKIFRKQEGANINDIPTELHTLKSESLRDLDADELAEVS